MSVLKGVLEGDFGVKGLKFEVVRRKEESFGVRSMEVVVNGKEFLVGIKFEVE